MNRKNVVVDVVEPLTAIKLTDLRWKIPVILLKLWAFRNPFNETASRVRVLKGINNPDKDDLYLVFLES